jgi:hypothetical protein
VNNKTFSRAVRLLAHPLSLAAIGLMLANDRVFKILWPSWWTDKLSDFAGLFFLPFLAAALLALVIPRRSSAWLAFGLTGLGFILIKTVPGVNALLPGLGLQARLDPTDLVALLSLIPAAWLWRRQQEGPALRLDKRLLLVPLAALVTLADAAAPDYGVTCLTLDGSKIMAQASLLGGSYQSADGGLTWQVLSTERQANCNPTAQNQAVIQVPAHGAQFRIRPGAGIDRSTDGGATWTVDFSILPASEAETTYVSMTRSGNLAFGSIPFAGLVEPASGNLVFAMGHDGVLLRRPNGEWSWAAVGTYVHNSLRLDGLAGILILVQYPIGLALLVAFGWLYTRAARRIPRTIVWVILGWVGLALLSLILSPEIVTANYLAIGALLALLFMAAATLIALLTAIFRLKGEFAGVVLSALPQMLGMGLACLLPYVLWAAGLLPLYAYALLASTVLVVLLFIIFSRTSRAREKI